MLESLDVATLPDSRMVEILTIVNGSNGAHSAERRYHQEQVAQLRTRAAQSWIPMNTVEALALPDKKAGVGLARKIAMDIALSRFARVDYDGWIHCLDGDCTVNRNYWRALLRAERQGVSGGVCGFQHPLDGLSEAERERIIRYEIFLRYYVLALRFAAYPYAFHTIGSCMGTRASAYARIGGMNQRKAGEDFYFLHKLMPQGGFGEIKEAVVYPSARQSDRVPFGTGRAMREMEQGSKSFEKLYHPQIFWELRQIHTGGETELWREFLRAMHWEEDFHKLEKRNVKRGEERFFHWWDGFKVLKFVHWRQQQLKGIPLVDACGRLLGCESRDLTELLRELRVLEDQVHFR